MTLNTGTCSENSNISED